jgi:hypothetical protein
LSESHVAVLVRPKARLTVLGVLTFVITVVPLFAVLYWYTAAFDVWRLLLALQIALLVASLAALFRQQRVFTEVSDGFLRGNGIFSRTTTVPLDEIDRVVMVPVYRNYPNETTIQFLAVGEHNESLFRMRGQFWYDEDFRAVAAAIGKPVRLEQTPLTEREFFELYPGSAYWFERG